MNMRKNSQEFEAESVSWIVCSRAGLSTPSAEYLAGYLDRDGNVPQDISPETIFKAAGMIKGMLERTPPFLKTLIVKQFEKNMSHKISAKLYSIFIFKPNNFSIKSLILTQMHPFWLEYIRADSIIAF